MSDEKFYNLKELGLMLKNVDKTIISLLARRMALSLQVFAFKKAKADKEREGIIEIIRPDKEAERINLAEEWAKIFGLNPLFARGIMYEIINESCKMQLVKMQTGEDDIRSKDHTNIDEWYEELKANLLKLTSIVATDYDKIYMEDASFSTAAYRRFEQQIIREIILDKLPSNFLALDLGCATGPMSFYLSDYFEQTKSFDISPDMISVAEKKKADLGIKNISFSVLDIENGLPLPDSTVSCIILNQGAASDIRKIKFLMKEFERVLIPRGRVFLSFYNKDALLYQFDFIPWPVSLIAEINFKAQCLEVHVPGHEPFFIYAKGYNIDEISELFQGKLMLEDIFSFPTISSILPEHLLDTDRISKDMEAIEKSLANSTFGSYLIAIGVKR